MAKGYQDSTAARNFSEPHYLACNVPEGHLDDIKARADVTGELLACKALYSVLCASRILLQDIEDSVWVWQLMLHKLCIYTASACTAPFPGESGQYDCFDCLCMLLSALVFNVHLCATVCCLPVGSGLCNLATLSENLLHILLHIPVWEGRASGGGICTLIQLSVHKFLGYDT